MKSSKIKSLKKEISFKGLDRRYDSDAVSSIDVSVLETFPYKYPGRDVVVAIDTNEFTAVCPYSGLPDYALIKINYVPRKFLIELRSLKYYLFSFRNVGMYQEHVVNRILEDLVRSCKPKWMQVVADYNLRGGLHTVTSAEWGKRKQ
jgi:7-cyano-7-deazaguanine reductase